MPNYPEIDMVTGKINVFDNQWNRKNDNGKINDRGGCKYPIVNILSPIPVNLLAFSSFKIFMNG